MATVRAKARGIFRASALIGVSRDTYERAAGGLPIRRGSAALIRMALEKIRNSSGLGSEKPASRPIIYDEGHDPDRS